MYCINNFVFKSYKLIKCTTIVRNLVFGVKINLCCVKIWLLSKHNRPYHSSLPMMQDSEQLKTVQSHVNATPSSIRARTTKLIGTCLMSLEVDRYD